MAPQEDRRQGQGWGRAWLLSLSLYIPQAWLGAGGGGAQSSFLVLSSVGKRHPERELCGSQVEAGQWSRGSTECRRQREVSPLPFGSPVNEATSESPQLTVNGDNLSCLPQLTHWGCYLFSIGGFAWAQGQGEETVVNPGFLEAPKEHGPRRKGPVGYRWHLHSPLNLRVCRSRCTDLDHGPWCWKQVLWVQRSGSLFRMSRCGHPGLTPA